MGSWPSSLLPLAVAFYGGGGGVKVSDRRGGGSSPATKLEINTDCVTSGYTPEVGHLGIFKLLLTKNDEFCF